MVCWAPLGRRARRELAVLVALAHAAGAIWAVAELADGMIEGETHASAPAEG